MTARLDKQSLTEWLKAYLLQVLKQKFVEAALKKVFGTLIGISGFKVWLISFVTKEFWDEICRPLVLWAIRKGLLVYDVTEGKIIVARIKRARDDSSQDDYDSAVDDLFD